MSVLDPTDFLRPPDLSAGLGTVAEKRVSISDTSNSGALREREKKEAPIRSKQNKIIKSTEKYHLEG